MTFSKYPIAALALASAGLLSAGGAQAASDTLVYCTVASPESFNPQLASSGPTFIATSQVLYNRLVTLRESDKTPLLRWPPNGASARTARSTPLPCARA